MASSALFAPYRTVGLVCDGAQQHVHTLGTATFFATPIGKAFQVFNCDHLTLAMVSRPIDQKIT
jgi:U3 small nucleolar RNA-associated protein 21